jgi:hypothetical protein
MVIFCLRISPRARRPPSADKPLREIFLSYTLKEAPFFVPFCGLSWQELVL